MSVPSKQDLTGTILVLGGYGNFGKRIVENLAGMANISLVVAGRDIKKANTLARQIDVADSSCVVAMQIDINKENFEAKLRQLAPTIVINTCGPFQGQDYRVPSACIEVGAHYIDLADDRRFVCDIKSLHDAAIQNNVLVVSGASSVPGLSSAVIDHCRHQFSEIYSIDIAIAPGNKAERGEATVRGILSCSGRAFEVYSAQRWRPAFGWMEPRRKNFGGSIGRRWLANVDVPDLELFPKRYSVRDTVRFQAGLELTLLHLTMVAMSYLARIGWVKDWSRMTKLMMKISTLFNYFGTDKGGMAITISGKGNDGKQLRLNWSLTAGNGVGPYVPIISAVIVARKILRGELQQAGATPCLALFGLEEFAQCAGELGIQCDDQFDG